MKALGVMSHAIRIRTDGEDIRAPRGASRISSEPSWPPPCTPKPGFPSAHIPDFREITHHPHLTKGRCANSQTPARRREKVATYPCHPPTLPHRGPPFTRCELQGGQRQGEGTHTLCPAAFTPLPSQGPGGGLLNRSERHSEAIRRPVFGRDYIYVTFHSQKEITTSTDDQRLTGMERPRLPALPCLSSNTVQCFHLLAQSSNHPSTQLGCVQPPQNNPKILKE